MDQLYEHNGYLDRIKNEGSRMNEDCGCGGTSNAMAGPAEPDAQDTVIVYTPDMYGGVGSCGGCGQQNGGCDCVANQDFSYGDLIRNIQSGEKGRVIDLDEEGKIGCVMEGGQCAIMEKSQCTIDEKYRVTEGVGCSDK